MVIEGYGEANTWGVFLGDESRCELSQMAETFEKIAPHLKTTLAGPLICDKTYPEKLSIASPENPLCVTSPIVLFMFLQ